MTDHDPLLGYLESELDRIDASAPLASLVGVELAPLPSDAETTTVLRCSWRYTWQEVERGRRYVIPLDRERPLAARRGLARQINESAGKASAIAVSEVQREIVFRAGMNVYEVVESVRVG